MDNDEILLEGICDYIDDRVAQGETVTTSLVLAEYSVPDKYSGFISEYIEVTEIAYTHQEEILDTGKSMDLSRIGWNTLMGGFAGGTIGTKGYTAPIGAAVGFGLTLYDEAKKIGLDLEPVFWGVVFGQWIGGTYGNELEYVGAAVGGALGLTKAGIEATKERKKKIIENNKKLRAIEDKHGKQKRAIIERSLPELLENYD